jgi:hypothetical protein
MPILYTLQNPGLVTVFEFDTVAKMSSMDTYGIQVHGPKNTLQTVNYTEGGPELWELSDTLGPVSWNVSVPGAATVFGAASGMSPDVVHQFWVGWIQGARVHMQALMQEHAIELTLQPDEVPIFPAIMDGDGTAALFSWRPVGTGAALWRHLFSGKIKTAGQVASEALSEIPGRPVLSAAGFVPGERAPVAVIGWLEAQPTGSVLGVAVVMPKQMRVLRSDPVPRTAPFMNQRPAVWAKPPLAEGQFQLVGVLQSIGEQPPSYQVAQLDARLSPSSAAVQLSDSQVAPGELQAAAFDYEKVIAKAAPFRALLTKNGTLFTGGNEPFPERVPIDSTLPLATGLHRYLGTRHPDGTLTFKGI